MKYLVIVLLSAILVGCYPAKPKEPELRVCTQEAKMCPDGKTYVSRNSAKQCEFDPCPQ